jgi:hypothetical protein
VSAISILASGVISAQMQPKLKLPAAIHPALRVEAFDATRHAAFRQEIASHFGAVQDAVFIISNKSEKDLTALAIRYVFIDRAGQQKGFRYVTDSYISRRSNPVLAAGSTMMVAPGTFLPESLAGKSYIGGATFSGRGLLDGVARRIPSAASIEVELDVAIFADGEMAGPNKLGFPSDIIARAAAARQIADIVARAQARGESPDSALQSVATTPSVKEDTGARWLRRLASDMLHQRTRRGIDTTPDLADIVTPPPFHTGQ